MSLNKKNVSYPVGNRSLSALASNRKFFGKHLDENGNMPSAGAKTRPRDLNDTLYRTNPNLKKSDFSAEKIQKLQIRKRESRITERPIQEELEHKKQVSEKFSYFVNTRPCFSYSFHPDVNEYAKQNETIFSTSIGMNWKINEKSRHELENSKPKHIEDCRKEKELERMFYFKSLDKVPKRDESEHQNKVKIDRFTTSPDRKEVAARKQSTRDNLLHHRYLPINGPTNVTSTEGRFNDSLKQFFPFEPKLRYGKTEFKDTDNIHIPEETSPLFCSEADRLVNKIVDADIFQNDVYADLRRKNMAITKSRADRRRQSEHDVRENAQKLEDLSEQKKLARESAIRTLKEKYIQVVHDNDPAHGYNFCSGERHELVQSKNIGYQSCFQE
ncbi:predicted protein [Naegleria gruberi]|uniref:Predicted protein n=1 Tax=Naegleria gruberi TaxID=5762 RepID=D2V9M5_NAEGR|nr:uncharacterized protein NAEGRDRAFT_65492 [Naegleria gruberi]EFC46491.1 predicted protein [Naegleria gruberi]|eukprot:XP_002679235.1 predicted protein [Naegleria gruberi strain NEG-M]